jgi:outer membrane lipoprotein-sorting protein
VLGPRDGEKRAVTLITVIHPTPRRNFRFHRAEVYLDNELGLPIRYAAYMWPQNPGEEPPLEEEYTYLNLKVNNGFTDFTFSRDNPELFKD